MCDPGVLVIVIAGSFLFPFLAISAFVWGYKIGLHQKEELESGYTDYEPKEKYKAVFPKKEIDD